jgi:hypothetical protein
VNVAQAPSEEDLLDAIMTLALEIARTSPDVTDKALRIADLVGELRILCVQPDRSLVHDILEQEAVDSDWSDGDVERTTEAIVKGLRDTK